MLIYAVGSIYPTSRVLVVVVRYNAHARCSVSGHPAAVAVATKI